MTMNEVGSSWEWRSREQDILLETLLEKRLEEIIHDYELLVDNEVGSRCEWSKRELDIAFETALEKPLDEILQEYDLFVDNVSLNQSDYVPLEEITREYDLLVDDVSPIQPGYNSPPERSTNLASEKGVVKKPSKSNQERRKTIHWTEYEHRLFLEGLEKYGDGDWKNISRKCVVTRTPTQVASHAQKYKIHQKLINEKKEKRSRSSIHDVTLEKNRDISLPQRQITCQASYSAAKLVSPPPSAEMFASMLTAGSYAAAPTAEVFAAALPVGIRTIDDISAPPTEIYNAPEIIQPVGGHFVSAIGTSENHTALAPDSGIVIPWIPINMGPMTYPMLYKYVAS